MPPDYLQVPPWSVVWVILSAAVRVIHLPTHAYELNSLTSGLLLIGHYWLLPVRSLGVHNRLTTRSLFGSYPDSQHLCVGRWTPDNPKLNDERASTK